MDSYEICDETDYRLKINEKLLAVFSIAKIKNNLTQSVSYYPFVYENNRCSWNHWTENGYGANVIINISRPYTRKSSAKRAAIKYLTRASM